MFKISKEFSFDMAHMLDGHDGKCKNLHGHTYKLQVELCAPLLTDAAKCGMVMDYSDLKSVVDDLILKPMDHAFIYDQHSEKERKVAELLQELDSKVFALPYRTTAEQMSQFIFQRLQHAGLPISAVRLWETPTSFCEYTDSE
ncbi:preQ(0) biosynthesis protein QueD [Pasteurella testudinis DSM 23072]|uniref:6-carboxy-5,6,7,8-tetrahydropterin synthase n=1 Tax=Pasteurella testudinis DSM 23072 TaxID=1122938 RepID=A0A1W1UL70_9PAST|nr:6-carboxytetrahydropterin synthase QueD [Pasteurella testudinis]SMB81875.1 preQ(0) biosynthesis protein QueD [Pasteurella testudinis DSM 23072]SUB50288.1 6-carboxy-5,6,7,8-tetrahydropterin synthase [Pasteurella testudinis]